MRFALTCILLSSGWPDTVTTFAQLFGLKDPQRVNLEFSPRHDAGLLIDLDNVVPWLEQRMDASGAATRAFYAVIQGDFGTGKTHVLRYAERVLAPHRGYRPVYVELGGFASRSGFFDLHIRVMSALMGMLEDLLRNATGLESWLDSQQGLNEEMKLAFRKLASPGTSTEDSAKVKAWLLGTGPTPSQARKVGFSGRLFERAGPIELVGLWEALGELEHHVERRVLLLLIDEGETFQRVVHPDAQANIGSGLRRLFEPDNRSLALLMGLNTPESRQGVHPMLRSDVLSRLQGKVLMLKPLEEPERIRRFVTELWKKVRPNDSRVELFTPEALDFLCRDLPSLRNALSLHQRNLGTRTTQRDLMRVLAFISERAWKEKRAPPLDDILLRQWFAL